MSDIKIMLDIYRLWWIKVVNNSYIDHYHKYIWCYWIYFRKWFRLYMHTIQYNSDEEEKLTNMCLQYRDKKEKFWNTTTFKSEFDYCKVVNLLHESSAQIKLFEERLFKDNKDETIIKRMEEFRDRSKTIEKNLMIIHNNFN